MLRRAIQEDARFGVVDFWGEGMGNQEFRHRMFTVGKLLRKCRATVKDWNNPVSPGVYQETMKHIEANFDLMRVHMPPDPFLHADFSQFYAFCTAYNEATKRMLAEKGHRPPGEGGGSTVGSNNQSEAAMRLEAARLDNQTAKINASAAGTQVSRSKVGSWTQDVARHSRVGSSVAGSSHSRARSVAPGDSASQVASGMSSRSKPGGGVYVAPGATLHIENFSAQGSKVGSSRAGPNPATPSQHPSGSGRAYSSVSRTPSNAPSQFGGSRLSAAALARQNQYMGS